MFEHFFYVRLLKYRYTDVYYALRAKEYIASEYIDGTGDYTKGEYYLEKGFENNLGDRNEKDKKAIKKVLNLLFPENLKPDDIRPIYDCASFETYFLDGISNVLSLESIKSLLGKSVQDAKLQIDEWVKSGCLNELMYYFGRGRKSKFDNQNNLELNVLLAFYLLKHTSNSNYCMALKDYLCLEKVKPLLEKFSVDEQQYKDFLRKLFTVDSQGQYIYNNFLQQNLEGTLITTANANETLIFNNKEFLEYAKNGLTYYLKKEISKNEENYISKGLKLLYSCIQENDGTNPPVLDKGACQQMKEYIESNPKDYISYFVLSEKNSIYPEPCYESIFGSKDEFDDFLKNENLNEIKGIELARNFWKLYESNGYSPIIFYSGVDVQKKIDENFSNEVESVRKIKCIQKIANDCFKLLEERATKPSKKVLVLGELKKHKQEFDEIKSKIEMSVELMRETEKLFDSLITKFKKELLFPLNFDYP